MDARQISTIAELLKKGSVGVIPTDTIYGIAASIFNKKAVERVYKETKRSPAKPFIILISNFQQLEDLEIIINDNQKNALHGIWPGPVSAVIASKNENLKYLHRGKNSLAFRLPDLEWLRDLLNLTGPLIATSANVSGLPTPGNLEDIKKQLPGLDFYYEDKVGRAASKLMILDADGGLKELSRS